MEIPETCPMCDGKGEFNTQYLGFYYEWKCSWCDGTGVVEIGDDSEDRQAEATKSIDNDTSLPE